jgi:hypothetical protein
LVADDSLRQGRRRGASGLAVRHDPVLVAAEDHTAGAGLQDAGDKGADVFADVLAAALDDDHRAVLEVADALARLLARLDDANFERFSRHKDGLEGVAQLVEVDDADVVELGDLVEVVVVGDDFAFEVLREPGRPSDRCGGG